MLLWITVALAGSGSSDGCIPDGSALYPTVEAPLDPARVRALVGPTLAALVATYAPHTYTPNGWFSHWIEPFKGPALPTEVRLPVWAPAPLTATVTLQVGAGDARVQDGASLSPPFACWVGALGRDRDRAGRAGLSPTSLSP